MNYNLELGDTIQVLDYYQTDDTLNILYATLFSTVSDTFSLDVGGQALYSREIRYKTIFYNGRNDHIFIDTLVPYLGLLNQYINPADASARAVDGGEGGFLRCYKNDDLGVVESPIRGNIGGIAYDCLELNPATSFGKPFDPSSILAYPNPSSEVLIIENTKHRQLSVKFIDLSGKTHETFSALPGKNEISISHFPAGLYFMVVEGESIDKVWIN